MIEIDITNINASSSGATLVFRVHYDNTSPELIETPVASADWISIELQGGGPDDTGISEQYEVTVTANEGAERAGTIHFEYEDLDGVPYNAYLDVFQGAGLTVEAPIWKDVYFCASGYGIYSYSILYEGEPFYYGKAYCRPGDAGPYIQVNRICQNHLRNNIDLSAIDDVVSNEGTVGLFSLCNGNGTVVMNYRFLMDYASDWSGQTAYTMSEPVNGHLDPRMKVLATVYNNGETDIPFVLEDYEEDYGY